MVQPQSQRWRRVPMALCLALGCVNGFTAVRGTKRQRTQTISDTILRYRKNGEYVAESLQPEGMAAAIADRSLLQRDYSHRMPAWLSGKSHLAEENMDRLKVVMKRSFYTESEIQIILSTIDEATLGDRNKIAGTAEFCTILVETMEMGFDALVAAVFHFRSCLTARENALHRPTSDHVSLEFWDANEIEEPNMPGDAASAIFKDAGRLKFLEMVFGALIEETSTGALKVSPSSVDAENLRNLLLAETKDWRGLAIRAGASLFRLRGLDKVSTGKLTKDIFKEAREGLYIFAPLASRLGMHRLKNEIEEISFRLLYPRQHDKVTSMLSQTRSLDSQGITNSADGPLGIRQSMKVVMETTANEIREMLQNDQMFSSAVESFDVSARVKEPFSMWKKMLRKGSKHVLEVPDAIALRIVLNTKKETPDEDDAVTRARDRVYCYYAQKLCTMRFAPMDGDPRYKDYIDRPKPNGYQSLHYTATSNFGGEEWTMEIQIRSGDMHQVAEYGFASHWDYKSKPKTESLGQDEGKPIPGYSSDAYLKALQDWHWRQMSASSHSSDTASASSGTDYLGGDLKGRARAHRIRERKARLEPYIKALMKAQSDLARDHIYVFLSQDKDDSEGDILALPSGACVLDALRARERKLGLELNLSRDAEITHNGALASLTRSLKNGDILVLPFDQAAEPAAPMMQFA